MQMKSEQNLSKGVAADSAEGKLSWSKAGKQQREHPRGARNDLSQGKSKANQKRTW